MSVVSNDGVGTVFTLRLPRVSPPTPARRGAEPKHVLIVDDDEVIRETLREAFAGEGYVATTASDGREALEQLQRGRSRPDVVILDMVMPIVDGARVYQAMQTDPDLAQIPVVVSTSEPKRAPAGAILIPKPVKLDRLLDTVARLAHKPRVAAATTEVAVGEGEGAAVRRRPWSAARGGRGSSHPRRLRPRWTR